METRCDAPQAPDSLDDGNRRSATVISTPASAALSSNWRRNSQNPNTAMPRRRSPSSTCALGRGGRLRHARAVLAQATDRLPAIVAPPHLPRHDFPQRAQAPPGVSVCRRSVHVKLEVPHRHRPAGPRPCECRPSRRVAGPSRIPAWVPVGDPSRFFSNPAVRETDQHRSLRETLIRPRLREAAAPPAGGLDARRRAPCGRSRCVFPDPTR